MRRASLLLAFLVVVVVLVIRVLPRKQAPVALVREDASYASTIKPLFDRRCVACHACLDSPCQLNLQSFEGVDRGANKTIVYRPERLEAMAPTRMFQDARSTEEWQRRFDFFAVIGRDPPDPLSESVLWHMVEQRKEKPVAGHFDVDAAPACPRTIPELTGVLAQRPELGMPFGLPPLSDADLASLSAWIRRGSGAPAPTTSPSDGERAAIAVWEAFFNADDPKSRLVARYVFEHLFLAHLRLENAPGRWFRLVRSRTASPRDIDEIATLRPYDDPGVTRPYYRLRPVTESIVVKTHVPYELNASRLARLRHIFFEAAWDTPAPAFPSYDPNVAANPFVTFQAIPAAARYEFLLDDAYYHVKSFIHGPVCKGQVALNVIDEHFLIFFLSPTADPAVTDPSYLHHLSEHLAVPAEGGDSVEAIYARFKLHELAYVRDQAARLAEAPGRSLDDLWTGAGSGPAVLTVYRHFDNAFVLPGAVGGVPKTAWVLDYPIFERMYYDLVAGFNVFGNLIHQISTRRYMNLLRIESENQFLRFMPPSTREGVRDSWYRGAGVSLLVNVGDPSYGGPAPRIAFPGRVDPKAWLVRQMASKAVSEPLAAGDPVQWPDAPIDGDAPRDRFERDARQLVARPAPFVAVFPDATLLRVRVDGAREGEDLVYTIVRNRSHANIDFMFLENDFLIPSEDTLHVVRGVAVSRPNLFLSLSSDDLPAFLEGWRALRPDNDTWARFLDRYGVRRTDAAFWPTFDFFNAEFPKLDPLGAGILDLLRYGND